MFWRRSVEPHEQEMVLGLLARWSRATARIDAATDAVRYVTAEQPLGLQSDEFEKARLEALAVLKDIQDETSDREFWPVVEDNKGALLVLELRAKLEESYVHQLYILRLMGAAAEAFRTGRDHEAPTNKELMSANRTFARVLDDMGNVGGKLGRHYRVSGQEIQRQL